MRYRLLEDGGVLETLTHKSIPEADENLDWQEYQEWLAQGNTPDPVDVPPAKTDAELLYESDQKMIRAVDWLLQHLVQKGVIQLADIPQALKDLYLERKAQRGA
jgi:hypothetical protein